MERIRLGNSDLEVSRLCLGTWNMEGSPDWGPKSRQECVDLLRYAQDSGCNFFDTAHVYGQGHAEECIGEAFAVDGRRERAVIATKIFPWSQGNARGKLTDALRHLRTDYVDIYYIHWPTDAIEDFLDELTALKDEGLTRHIAVSNFEPEQLEIAARHDVVCFQPPYNALWRTIEPRMLPFCREHNLAVTPYCPLAQGLLTGRFSRTSNDAVAGPRSDNMLFQEPVFTEARKAAAVVDDVADAHGAASATVALAWLLQTDGVTAPVVGASRPGHWDDAVAALDLTLTDEQYTRISDAGMAVWQMLPPDSAMWGWKP